jgi:hypothetical protein
MERRLATRIGHWARLLLLLVSVGWVRSARRSPNQPAEGIGAVDSCILVAHTPYACIDLSLC